MISKMPHCEFCKNAPSGICPAHAATESNRMFLGHLALSFQALLEMDFDSRLEWILAELELGAVEDPAFAECRAALQPLKDRFQRAVDAIDAICGMKTRQLLADTLRAQQAHNEKENNDG